MHNKDLSYFSVKNKTKTNTNKQNQKISNLPLRLVKIIFWDRMINRAVGTQLDSWTEQQVSG